MKKVYPELNMVYKSAKTRHNQLLRTTKKNNCIKYKSEN